MLLYRLLLTSIIAVIVIATRFSCYHGVPPRFIKEEMQRKTKLDVTSVVDDGTLEFGLITTNGHVLLG